MVQRGRHGRDVLAKIRPGRPSDNPGYTAHDSMTLCRPERA
jgi:hypothetical protein